VKESPFVNPKPFPPPSAGDVHLGALAPKESVLAVPEDGDEAFTWVVGFCRKVAKGVAPGVGGGMGGGRSPTACTPQRPQKREEWGRGRGEKREDLFPVGLLRDFEYPPLAVSRCFPGFRGHTIGTASTVCFQCRPPPVPFCTPEFLEYTFYFSYTYTTLSYFAHCTF